MISHIITSEKINEEISFDKIRSIHGKTRILEDFPIYLMDESKLKGEADWLFFPKSEGEIGSILKFVRDSKIQTHISAARTGIVGASVPSSGSIISIEKMNKIIGLGFDEDKGMYFIRVEPGITLQELNDKLMNKEFENITELTPDVKKKYNKENKLFHYPVDPTEMSASIGGTVATNASGARTLKYGPTRDWIKGLRVVLSSGEILDIQRGKFFASDNSYFIINHTDGTQLKFRIPNYIFNTSVKNAAGIYSKPSMDLIDLFIGSEGILGIVTQIDIWIIEKHQLISNVLFFKAEEDALNFADMIRNNLLISTDYIEFFSNQALDLLRKIQVRDPDSLKIPQIPKDAQSVIFFDFPYMEDKLEKIISELSSIAENCNADLSNGWSGYEDQDHTRFKQFRHALPENVNAIIAQRKQKFPEFHKLGTDMSVPQINFRNMMKYYHSILQNANLDYVIYGHIGDYHVHVNILPKNMEEFRLGEKIYEKFATKAVEYGGSISAEHGIGKIKKEYLKIMYSHKELDEMRLLKRTLDPSLILNCGNIISFKMEEE
ncbi:MAG: FAD-binding protein [Candidatus Lokiarchaeota archaeon]|nr:FAD-binding protein [Candidatus Lokiarchaeota archaeon]